MDAYVGKKEHERPAFTLLASRQFSHERIVCTKIDFVAQKLIKILVLFLGTLTTVNIFKYLLYRCSRVTIAKGFFCKVVFSFDLNEVTDTQCTVF